MSIVLVAIREQIRRRLVSATLVGDRVYRSRVVPLEAPILPAILVRAGDETVAAFNAHPGSYQRTARVWVEVVGRFQPKQDDVLELIASQVEATIGLDSTLAKHAAECTLAEVSRPDPSTEGRITLAAIRLGFDVTYQTEFIDPDALLDLELLRVNWDLAIPDDVLEAVDEIDLTE